MNQVKYLVILITATLIAFTGCKKDEDDNGGSNPASGSMTLKANGTDWSATLAVVASNSGGLVTVTGSDSNAHQAQVVVMGSSTGTYNIVAGGSNMGRWTVGTGMNDTYMANGILGSGSITITELTATGVKGTFTFQGVNSATNTVNITEGKFEASF